MKNLNKSVKKIAFASFAVMALNIAPMKAEAFSMYLPTVSDMWSATPSASEMWNGAKNAASSTASWMKETAKWAAHKAYNTRDYLGSYRILEDKVNYLDDKYGRFLLNLTEVNYAGMTKTAFAAFAPGVLNEIADYFGAKYLDMKLLEKTMEKDNFDMLKIRLKQFENSKALVKLLAKEKQVHTEDALTLLETQGLIAAEILIILKDDALVKMAQAEEIIEQAKETCTQAKDYAFGKKADAKVAPSTAKMNTAAAA